MRWRSLYAVLLKENGCFLLQRFGMTGFAPRAFRFLRSSALS